MTGLGSQDTLRFQFPSCWEDDVTMSGRFAIPRSETVNPYDWPGKFKFWKDLIIEWASFNKKLTIEYEELKNAFTRKGKYPATLERVLTEMNKQGIIHLQDQYLYQNTKSSWTSWGIGLVKTSVSWSWSKVMSALVEIEREAPRYVVPSVLQEMSECILLLPIAVSGEVVEIDELGEMYPEFFSDSQEAHILLTHLHKTGKIAIDTTSPQTMIKFIVPEKTKSNLNSSFRSTSSSLSPIQSKSKNEKPSEITEVDRSLAKLKKTEKLLEDEIDELEFKMSALKETAKTRLKEGSRGAAKSALCHRKKLQETVDKHSKALMNIQTLKIQLNQAKTDSKVMEAYKIGLSALKTSLSDLPLNEDKLQDTLFELEDVLEQHRDIENMLSTTIAPDDVTESDLEDELMNILEEEKKREEELHLPSVPTDSPDKESASKKKAFQKEQHLAR